MSIHPVYAIARAGSLLESSPSDPSIIELHSLLVDLARQADAGRQLIQASDDVLGREWRHSTLNQGDAGDALNAAWDRLVAAVEGGEGEGRAAPSISPETEP